MFNENKLRQLLPVNELGEQLSFHLKVSSTNDVAYELANQGASHGTLVVAEAQTKGRGQRGKKWITVPGKGLALSVILRHVSIVPDLWARLHAISALAIAGALEKFQLNPEIKWPNDILLNGKKVAGVLVEASWDGDHLDFIILGVGINVSIDSELGRIPLEFPAVSLEEVLGKPVDQYELVVQLLKGISTTLALLDHRSLFESWEQKLAYRGQEVNVLGPETTRSGILLGLNDAGMVEVCDRENEIMEIGIGDFQIRLIEG